MVVGSPLLIDVTASRGGNDLFACICYQYDRRKVASSLISPLNPASHVQLPTECRQISVLLRWTCDSARSFDGVTLLVVTSYLLVVAVSCLSPISIVERAL